MIAAIYPGYLISVKSSVEIPPPLHQQRFRSSPWKWRRDQCRSRPWKWRRDQCRRRCWKCRRDLNFMPLQGAIKWLRKKDHWILKSLCKRIIFWKNNSFLELLIINKATIRSEQVFKIYQKRGKIIMYLIWLKEGVAAGTAGSRRGL